MTAIPTVLTLLLVEQCPLVRHLRRPCCTCQSACSKARRVIRRVVCVSALGFQVLGASHTPDVPLCVWRQQPPSFPPCSRPEQRVPVPLGSANQHCTYNIVDSPGRTFSASILSTFEAPPAASTLIPLKGSPFRSSSGHQLLT
jgi:hypothetical protein